MQIIADAGRLAGLFLGIEPQGEGPDQPRDLKDVVEISREARRLYEERFVEQFRNGTYTLGVLDDRVGTIYQQIDDLWRSPLPYGRKVMETRTRENEIALLRAGQFEFMKGLRANAAV